MIGVRGLPGLESETWGTQTYDCLDVGHPPTEFLKCPTKTAAIKPVIHVGQ